MKKLKPQYLVKIMIWCFAFFTYTMQYLFVTEDAISFEGLKYIDYLLRPLSVAEKSISVERWLSHEIPKDRLTGVDATNLMQFISDVKRLDDILINIYRTINGTRASNPDEFRSWFDIVRGFIQKWGGNYPRARIAKAQTVLDGVNIEQLFSEIGQKGFNRSRVYNELRDNLGDQLLDKLLVLDTSGEGLGSLGFIETEAGSGLYRSPDPEGEWLVATRGGFIQKIIQGTSRKQDLSKRYIKDEATKIVGFCYYLRTAGIGETAIRVENNNVKFEASAYGVLAGTVRLKSDEEIPLDLTPEQRYVELPDKQGFKIGGQNTDETLQKITALTGRRIQDIEYRMRPGRASRAGFLNRDESLISVLVRDNKYVREQGFTHQQLAEPLFYAMNLSGYFFGTNEISEFIYRGMWYKLKLTWWGQIQSSVFNDGLETNKDFTVTNLETNATVTFSGLVPYYIWRYGFYEGQTAYRVEPQRIINVFFPTLPHPHIGGLENEMAKIQKFI